AAGATAYTFQITYTDDTAVNVSTLGNGNVQVTGPNGFSQAATFVSVDTNTNGTPRTATYSITPPGGAWRPSAYRTYNVSVVANQVAEPSRTFVRAGATGQFQALIPTTFTVTNANDSGAGSLRQAITDANARTGTADTITFDSTFFATPRTVALQTALPAIAE